MRMQRQLLSALIILAFSLTGCLKDNPVNSGGGGDFTVNISSETTPEYAWSSGNAFSISVMRADAPTAIVWGLATPGQGNIASPAAHGTTPAGAIQTSASEKTLTAGVKYRVSVSLLDGKTGFTEFTP